MSYSTVIFDLDGTLLDTLEDLADTGNQMLEQRGYPSHPPGAYRYFVGDGMRTLVDRITPEHISAEEKDTCFELFRSLYSQQWKRGTRPYAGVPELLATLHRQGLGLCVLSNKPHDFTHLCVDHFFPENPFQLVFGQRADVAKKPDPAGALEIADRLGASVDTCIYVGDTKVDMQTGKAAGMLTIGVLWGFRDRTELQENGADMIVATPADLGRAIKNLVVCHSQDTES